MDLGLIIRMAHVVGTVLGVGGVTMLTTFYIQSKRDGNVDPTEVTFLKIATKITNIGLWVLIFSGLGFFVDAYFNDPAHFAIQTRTGFKLIITGLLLVNTWLLHQRKLSAWTGGAWSLASWYAAMILGLWRGMPFNYWQLTIGYIMLIGVAYGVLIGLKKYYKIDTVPPVNKNTGNLGKAA